MQEGRSPDDDRPVVFLVQDEARFGRITQPVKCWAPLGIRPNAPNQIGSLAIYAFAAIAPKTGQMTALILTTANSDMMSLFLEQVSKDFIGSFVVMQVDGASWHHSQKVRIEDQYPFHFPATL